MIFLKKVINIFLLSALFSMNALASDMVVETSIDDSASEFIYGGQDFNINKMDIRWTGEGNVTVDVYTNFTNVNNVFSTGNDNGEIVFGDLLMSTNGADTPYNYAFILSDQARYMKNEVYQGFGASGSEGVFTEISSTKTAKQFHNNSSEVQDGQVVAGNRVGAGNQGYSILANKNTYWNNSSNFNKISFNFNVSGISAFQNASQVAFSWTMTCANDVIKGVVDIASSDGGGPTSVPEPATVLLILIGLGFLVNRKTNTNKSTSF